MAAEPKPPPHEPPLNYDPAFGTVLEWRLATAAWAAYWSDHAHPFRECTLEGHCVECLDCGLARMAVVHLNPAFEALLRGALDSTGPIVEMLIRNLHGELAVTFAQQGLRAARLLGLYRDDA